MGLVLSGAVGGALVVGAIMTAFLRRTGRVKTMPRDGPPNVEMLRLNSNQEDVSLHKPFLSHGNARAPAPLEVLLPGDEDEESRADAFQ